jgi:hypothetical protein
VFTTRPVGMTTILNAIAWPLDPNAPTPHIGWHIELCCQSWRDAVSMRVDISAAAGALVTVRNRQTIGAIQVFTDYI